MAGGDGRIERAREFYERAVFGGDSSGLATADRELDAVEADVALARGRVIHARFLEHREREDPRELALFERAARLYEELGDVRGHGEALFWVGTCHQVVRRDDAAAAPALARSAELAAQAGDRLTLSYALRHQGIAEHMAGRHGTARERLEESTRLRREIGFAPGVAANLVGLAYLAAEEKDLDRVRALLGEAAELAAAGEAHGMTRMIEEARTELGQRGERDASG